MRPKGVSTRRQEEEAEQGCGRENQNAGRGGGASHGGGERRGDRKEEDAQRLKPKIKNCRVK